MPKDTAGSFIMTFHTDAVADLLGVEESNPVERLQQEGDPEGGPSSQADVQPSLPSSFYLPDQELVHRAALALKTREPSFTVYKIPKECEP